MKILITGGAGFIGSHLCRRLLAEGHTLTVLDAFVPQVHGPLGADAPAVRWLRSDVRLVVGSVLDAAIWSDVLPGQDAVIHLAADTGTGQSMYALERYVGVNAGGTAAMMEWLVGHSHDVHRIVVASSRAVYGEGKYADAEGAVHFPGPRSPAVLQRGDFEHRCPSSGGELRPVPTDEASVINPVSVYGVTKWAQERLVMLSSQSIGIEAVALRYHNVFGPGQSLGNPYTGILSIFTTRARNGNPIDVYEDGRESRDFVYIDDVVDATVAALTIPEAAHEVFNIGTGSVVEVRDVAAAIAAAYTPAVPWKITGAFRPGDIRHAMADIRKARQLLGFHPRYPFLAGLRHFIAWAETQDLPSDSYGDSVLELHRRGLWRG